ncbi:hypothetical protein [Glaciecola sp. MF2-115]|uniref:hypothetical protein n=1 Tax=Glaciecola sp. MF2-115 TaxID=3384827 RepID=UPI0039A0007B
MHLSDQQLQDIEIDRKDAPNNMKNKASFIAKLVESEKAELHLAECLVCQERLSNLSHFRQKLFDDTHCVHPKLNWSAIENELDVKSTRTQLRVLKTKIKHIQLTFVALAATFLIVLFYPNLHKQMHSQEEQQLRALIEENYALQQEFTSIKQASLKQLILLKSTQISLQKIDQEIQLSYLDDLTIEEKINLWNERKHLLMKSLEEDSQPALIII